MGEIEKTLDCAQRATALGVRSPLPIYMLCFALSAAGRNDEALSLAQELLEQSQTEYISPYFVGMSLLGAGEVDRAFVEFEKAQSEKSAWLVWWGTEPKLDCVRNDERYWQILRETRNPIIDQLQK